MGFPRVFPWFLGLFSHRSSHLWLQAHPTLANAITQKIGDRRSWAMAGPFGGNHISFYGLVFSMGF
jgi:hypothetical protein